MVDFCCETPISINDAARFLGVSRQCIENWLRSGLDSSKVGGKRFTSKEAIQRFSTQGELSPRITEADRDEALSACRSFKAQNNR